MKEYICDFCRALMLPGEVPIMKHQCTDCHNTEDKTLNEEKITRVEVIENSWRKYTKWNCKIELSVQDEGRTLKIFVGDK